MSRILTSVAPLLHLLLQMFYVSPLLATGVQSVTPGVASVAPGVVSVVPGVAYVVPGASTCLIRLMIEIGKELISNCDLTTRRHSKAKRRAPAYSRT